MEKVFIIFTCVFSVMGQTAVYPPHQQQQQHMQHRPPQQPMYTEEDVKTVIVYLHINHCCFYFFNSIQQKVFIIDITFKTSILHYIIYIIHTKCFLTIFQWQKSAQLFPYHLAFFPTYLRIFMLKLHDVIITG